MISKQYQNYSNKNIDRNINLTLNFLKNQIELYKEKSNLSMVKLQKFSLKV